MRGLCTQLLVILLISPNPLRAAVLKSQSPHAGAGVGSAPPEYSGEEREELEQLDHVMSRFAQDAEEYRKSTREIIQYKYQKKRDRLFNSYESMIVELEGDQRVRRGSAIEKFEGFVQRYPDHEGYTPSAMFRLSELYFERSYDVYYQARQVFDKEIDAWEPDTGVEEPSEPTFHYEPTIAMMQRLIIEFPGYDKVDGAYYLLGFCLGEQGEEERAVDVYHELVRRRPDSHFSPEVWTRIGEYYFNANELDRALEAYTQVLGHVDSPFYDKALYKLAWTHYRLADPVSAPQEFQSAVDTFVQLLEYNEQSKAAGKERGGDLRDESIEYVAISYSDEEWGSTDMLLAYLDKIGRRPYEREILVALGNVYFNQTRFDESIRVLKIVQERYPLHPDAPLVQEQIVTAYERDRDFEKGGEARDALTKNFSKGSAWYNKNKDNEEALASAQKLTEKSLYSAALFHHRQAQVHKDGGNIDAAKTEYALAAEAYRDYLKRFPHDKQLYELSFYLAECLYYSLQFDEAAVQYSNVRDSNANNKYLSDSAYSVILSYENGLKLRVAKGEVEEVKVMTSADRTAGAPIKPKDIPKIKLAAIAASDRYEQLLPQSEDLPKILYKVAEIFYAYDHLEEARRRFMALLDRFPDDEVAEFASNLIIESYLAENNFAAVEKFTSGMLTKTKTSGKGRRGFRTELVKFRSGAMFKIAEDKAAKGEHEEAAELYVKLLDENPDTKFADLAINNAAVEFEKVNRFDSASRLYERLVREHPKSALADQALFRVGLNAERFFDFDKAIKTYLSLVKKYPKSESRADAIYNAALSMDNTQDYERSAAQYLQYCKLFPKRDDAPAVCFKAGEVYEKMDDSKRVISTYRNFIRKYARNKDHADRIIEAHLRIAKAQEKLGKDSDARKSYDAVIKTQARTKDAKSAPYAAEARFQLVERQFNAFKRMKFVGKSKLQQKTLVKKAERLKQVSNAYKGVLEFKQIEWTLAALFRIGQLYQEFADSLVNAECPPDVKRAARSMGATAEEVCDEYRVLLEDRAATLEDTAVQAFETTINRAREFQVANRWTKATLVQLNKLRRKLWPLQKDARVFLDDVVDAVSAGLDHTGAPIKPAPPVAKPAPAIPAPAPPASDKPQEPATPDAAGASGTGPPTSGPAAPAAEASTEEAGPENTAPPPPPPPPGAP